MTYFEVNRHVILPCASHTIDDDEYDGDDDGHARSVHTGYAVIRIRWVLWGAWKQSHKTMSHVRNLSFPLYALFIVIYDKIIRSKWIVNSDRRWKDTPVSYSAKIYICSIVDPATAKQKKKNILCPSKFSQKNLCALLCCWPQFTAGGRNPAKTYTASRLIYYTNAITLLFPEPVFLDAFK